MTPDDRAAEQIAPRPRDLVDRLIPVAVNVFGLLAVGALALYLGGALATGVTANAIAFVGVSAVIALMFIAPHINLLLWAVFAPFGRLLELPLGRGLPDLSFERVTVLGLAALLSAQALAGKRKLARLTAVEGWGLVFALALTLSVGASRLGINAGIQSVFDTVVVPLLFFYFARNLLSDGRRLKWLAVAVAILGATLGIIAAREQLTGLTVFSPVPYRWSYGENIIKVNSFFGAPAVMAMTIAVPVPFVLVAALRSRGLGERVLWFGALAAMSAGLLLTYVRAGWLGAICGALVVIALMRRLRTFGLPALLIVLIVMFGASRGLLDTSTVEQRIESEQPISYRVTAIRVGLELAATSPVFGIGLDNFSDAAAAAGWQPRSGNATLAVAAHNMFIYVLTSAGVLALVPLLALLTAIALAARRMLQRTPDDRDWGAAALGMLVAYVLVAGTIDALSAQLANNLFYLCLGAIFGVAETRLTESARRRVQIAQDAIPGGVST